MKSASIAMLLSVVGLSAVLATPAEAARKRKPHGRAAPVHVTVRSAQASEYVDPTLGPFGPGNAVIFSNRVIGVDPDPNIRFQILRDIGGYFGGGSN